MRLLKGLALICIWVLCTPAWTAGALAAPADANLAAQAVEISVSSPVPVMLMGEDAVYTFAPEANSMYGVYLFAPEDSAAWLSARLYRANGRQMAAGSAAEGLPCAIAARLTAGERYTLVVSGVGRATLEIARRTLGRCFDDPILLGESGSYAKLIARAGDSHWYAFEAGADVPATVGILPEEEGLDLSAVLYGASGKALARSQVLDEGACAVYAQLERGEVYYLRVEAAPQQTGAYRLQVMYSAEVKAVPTRLVLDRETVEFDAGGRMALGASLEPERAHAALIWRSSDSSVARVTATGEVIALTPGEATVTAYGYGGLQASCEVSVRGRPLTGVHFVAREVELRAGERQKLEYRFEPAGAYTSSVRFDVEDTSVASLDEDGALLALAPGTTRVTVYAGDGAFSDSAEFTVLPAAPSYRALLVGEQIYLPEVNKVRTGAINTVQNLSEMLQTFDFDGQAYTSEMLLDATAVETVRAIRETFADAQPQDISLFYITCHGYYQGGMSYLQFYDGSLLSAMDLERELRAVPGTVVLLVDCCASGGFLGKATRPEDFNRGIVRVFSGRVGGAPFAKGKYKVLASAALDEDSYRISFDEELTEDAMATVFARALTDGAGWSIGRGKRAAMRADADMDRVISLQELYLYAARRVTWYLRMAGGASSGYVQNVQVYPEGDPFALFERSAK